MKNNTIQNTKIAILSLILVLGISYASADWTAAPASPPNNNAYAPLNVGVSGQAKAGGLAVATTSIQNLLDGYSFAVPSGISLFKTIVGSGNMVIYGSGGFGTPNYSTGSWPSTTLDVNGDAKVRGNMVVSGTRTLNGTPYAPGPGKVLTSADTLGTVYWATPSAGAGTTTPSYWTASGNNIYNNNAGNVGIGTLTPTAKLDVTGSAKISSGLTVAGEGSFGAGSVKIGTGSEGFYGDTQNIAIRAKNRADSDIYFQTYNGVGTNMIIKNNGNVGIGTNSPTSKLTVSGGDVSVSGWVVASALSGTGVQIRGTSGNYYFEPSTDYLILKDGPSGLVWKNLAINGLYADSGIITRSLILPTDAGEGKVLTSDATGVATWRDPNFGRQTIRWDKWVEVRIEGGSGWVECNSGWIITSTGHWTSDHDNEPSIVRCTRVDPTFSNPAYTTHNDGGSPSVTTSNNPYN